MMTPCLTGRQQGQLNRPIKEHLVVGFLTVFPGDGRFTSPTLGIESLSMDARTTATAATPTRDDNRQGMPARIRCTAQRAEVDTDCTPGCLRPCSWPPTSNSKTCSSPSLPALGADGTTQPSPASLMADKDHVTCCLLRLFSCQDTCYFIHVATGWTTKWSRKLAPTAVIVLVKESAVLTRHAEWTI